MVTGQSGDPKLLQIEIHHFKSVELFIIFPKSPKSSKSEFGARSYARNTKGCWCCFWHAAWGGGSPCLGWRCTTPGLAMPPPRLGYALAASLVAFSNPWPTQTCSFHLLFLSNLIQNTSNNSCFVDVPTPLCVHHLVHVC